MPTREKERKSRRIVQRAVKVLDGDFQGANPNRILQAESKQDRRRQFFKTQDDEIRIGHNTKTKYLYQVIPTLYNIRCIRTYRSVTFSYSASVPDWQVTVMIDGPADR